MTKCEDCGQKLSNDTDDLCVECDLRRQIDFEAPFDIRSIELESVMTTPKQANEFNVIAEFGKITASSALEDHLTDSDGIAVRDTSRRDQVDWKLTEEITRRCAVDFLRGEAFDAGANAIAELSVSQQSEFIDGKSQRLMVAAGTAIKVDPKSLEVHS